MPELDEKKRIIAYDTVNDPDENYYALIDNGTAGTGKVSIKGLGPADMISDQYSDSSTYKVGDLCIHNNKLYVCTVAINTPHAFNLSEWELDTLGNYASQIKQSLSQLNSALSQLFKTKMITHNFTANANANVAWNGWTECNDEDGYTPIGVLDFACNTSSIEVVNCTILNTSGGMTIKNISNSSVTNFFLYTVLYQKNL